MLVGEAPVSPDALEDSQGWLCWLLWPGAQMRCCPRFLFAFTLKERQAPRETEDTPTFKHDDFGQPPLPPTLAG